MTDLEEHKKKVFYRDAFQDINEWIQFLKYLKTSGQKIQPPSFESFIKARTQEFKDSLKI